MKMKLLKITTLLLSLSMFGSTTIPTIIYASETDNYQELTSKDTDLNLFAEEEKRSEQALELIEEKYGNSSVINTDDNHDIKSPDEYTLTEEDELKIDNAIEEYLKLVGYEEYNPYLRGVGRNWWNSRGFVGGVLDAAFIAIGFGAGIKSSQSLMKIIRANRRNITRTIEQQIRKHIGLSVGAYVSAGLNIIGSISQVSLGYAVAWSIDYVDGRRLDGYIFA